MYVCVLNRGRYGPRESSLKTHTHTPTQVVVESKDDAAAFKDFTISSVAPPAAPEKKAEPAAAAPAPAPVAPTGRFARKAAPVAVSIRIHRGVLW